MATRKVIVEVKNVGNVTYTFWVGCTISDRVAGSGCGIYIPPGAVYQDLPPKSVTIAPGEVKRVEFTFDDYGGNLRNTRALYLYAIVKVWKRKVGNRLEGCLAGTYVKFERTKIIKAQIVRVVVK